MNDTPENYAYQGLITELANNAQLPTVYPNRSFVEIGGLMAYGPDTVSSSVTLPVKSTRF